MKNGKPFLVASCADLGREVWARWDHAAELYELCASLDMDDPIGEAASVAEAQRVARGWFKELMEG
jgi:hypothetical protein